MTQPSVPGDYVARATGVCTVCGRVYETGDVLLSERLRSIPEHCRNTGWAPPCKSCATNLNNGERIALVGIDPDKLRDAMKPNGLVDPAQVCRTGELAFLRREVWFAIFDVPCPDGLVVFVEPSVIKMLQPHGEEIELGKAERAT